MSARGRGPLCCHHRGRRLAFHNEVFEGTVGLFALLECVCSLVEAAGCTSPASLRSDAPAYPPLFSVWSESADQFGPCFRFATAPVPGACTLHRHILLAQCRSTVSLPGLPHIADFVLTRLFGLPRILDVANPWGWKSVTVADFAALLQTPA